MSATNASIIDRAIKDYTKKMYDEVEKRCDVYCRRLLICAIDARLNAPRSHNFTGNLITSIVVCLYREKKPLLAYFASDQLDGAIAVKMSAPNYYWWKTDWDGAESAYKPEIETDMGFGETDARRFFQQYRPMGNNLFDIVVAYPVEYAEYIEQIRQTTGIIRAYDDAERFGVEFLGLPRS